MTTLRRRLLLACSAGSAALATTSGALAQSSTADTADLSEVVVTGSRITTGFATPTPVTVATAEQLKLTGPSNLADGLVQLPVFGANVRSGTPTSGAGQGTNGQNLVNLRSLGVQRTLVLLDGRRLPATNGNGSTNVDILPQNLVSRVDVVTGGASAAYGSDAVAGVVNFVLDTRFEGFKGELQGGISKYNDLGSRGLSLAYGKGWAGGRGRIIISGEYFEQDGVRADEESGRDWFDSPAGRIPNPVVGTTPRALIVPDLRSSLATFGGLISTGPLRGTQFLAGGGTSQLVYGPIVGSNNMSGGEGAILRIGLSPDQDRRNLFAHAEYDLTDTFTGYVEALYGKSHVNEGLFRSSNVGAGSGFTIFRDNAFLPAAVLQRMITANVQSFPLGRYNNDFPLVEIEQFTEVTRLAAGFKGEIGARWRWDGYYTYGKTDQELRENNLADFRKLYAAVDAVRNPATGQIVCRSTLAGLDAGCIPLNLFGEGSPSQAAIDAVLGDSVKSLTIKQQVLAVNVSGDRPIGVAAGLEYRRESAVQTADAVSTRVLDFTGLRGFPAAAQGRLGGFALFNPQPLAGRYNVKEIYGELAVPLLRDQPFAKALELNGAVRYADYNLSGGATSWKVGVNYQVIDDLRLRYTRSRNIRGANIQELFNSRSQSNPNQVYFGVTLPSIVISSGNPNLDPEQADTTTYGFVVQPSALPGLQFSADYYDIDISGAIGRLPGVVALCVAGNQVACSQVTLTPSNTLIVIQQELNLGSVKTAGYDFEVSYNRPLWDGNLSVRLLANRLTKALTSVPGGPPVESIKNDDNSNNVYDPRWRASLQLRYARDNWSVFLQERYIHKSLLFAGEVDGVDSNDNKLPAIAYTTIGGSYTFEVRGREQEVFFNISNLFDTDPPVGPAPPTSVNSEPTPRAYDRFGRYYTAGIRFRW